MRRPRLFSLQPLQTGAEVALDAQASRHLLATLRLGEGAEILLFDGSGREYQATLHPGGRREARARVGDLLREEAPPALHLHLGIGISRGERMDYALQKAVELGVGEISPLLTERTLVQLRGSRRDSRMAHWQGVIRHACEQCGRARLPTLHPPRPLAAWLAEQQGPGILLDHRAERSLPQLAPPDGGLALLVGPEGGLAPAEREAAVAAGLQPVRLGPRILRTETAPLAALAAIQTLWGDFR